MTDKKKTKKEETQPTRLRTLLEGLAMAAGSIVVGISLLALIGLIPGHQESRTLQPVLWVVSLGMMLGAVWGLWMVAKALFSGLCVAAKSLFGSGRPR
jgi:hypothetical protein